MVKIYNNIGLINRSRKLIIGSESVIAKIRSGSVKLVLISADVSFNTLKQIQDKCFHYNVELIILNDYENGLGQILGSDSIKVIGIENNNFYKMLKK